MQNILLFAIKLIIFSKYGKQLSKNQKNCANLVLNY